MFVRGPHLQYLRVYFRAVLLISYSRIYMKVAECLYIFSGLLTNKSQRHLDSTHVIVIFSEGILYHKDSHTISWARFCAVIARTSFRLSEPFPIHGKVLKEDDEYRALAHQTIYFLLGKGLFN